MVEQVVIIKHIFNLSCSHLYFFVCFFFLFSFELCSAVFSFLYCNDMVCQQITVQTVKEHVNLVQSFAINLPLRCNQQLTIVIKTLAIVYIRTSLQSTVILIT